MTLNPFVEGALEFSAFALCFFVVILGASSGTSGGALFMPILIIVSRYSAPVASVFSQTLICGSMGMNFLIFLFQKYHPHQALLQHVQEKDQNPKIEGEESRKTLVEAKPKVAIPEAPQARVVNPAGLQQYWTKSLKNYFISLFTTRPVVQYDLVCIFEPASLAGTVVGVLGSLILPEWAVLTALFLLTIYFTWTIFQRGVKLQRIFAAHRKKVQEEKRKLQKQQQQQQKKQKEKIPKEENKIDEENDVETAEVVAEASKLESLDEFTEIDLESQQTQKPKITETVSDVNRPKTILPTEMRAKTTSYVTKILYIFEYEANLNFPPLKMLFLLIGLALVFIASIARGSKKYPSLIFPQIAMCSWQYWAITFAAMIILFAMGYLYAGMLMLRHYSVMKMKRICIRAKIDSKIPETPKEREIQETARQKLKDDKFVEDSEPHKMCHGYDLVFDWKKALLLPLAGFLGGMLAAALGVGPAVIIVPVMAHLGISPVVMASTSSAMIFATSASAIIQYIIYGVLPISTLLVLLFISALGAAIGQLIVGSFVKKTGNTYAVMFLIVFVSILCLIFLGFQMAFSIYGGIFLNVPSGLKNPC